jgi:amino acid transporter
MLVAISFAEVSSRFDKTGGTYIFTRTAFGPFVGFEVAWMQWFTRVVSYATVVNGIPMAIGFYWPEATADPFRTLLITGATVLFISVNVLGIRESAWLVNTLTVGKLLPLVLFIAIGLPHVDPSRLAAFGPVGVEQAGAAALLLIFVFGGFDVVPVPAGEAHDPRRHVPFALVATLTVVTVVFVLAQATAMGTLPDIARTKTPLADAAQLVIGGGGALMVGVGSIVAMCGNLAGQVLTGSRMLFAMADRGDLPAWLARVHPVFRTPAQSILATGLLAWTLALSGSFTVLATASAVSRLVTYTGTCAATLALRSPRFAGVVPPATFVAPFGPAIPLMAILVSLFILAGASRELLLGGGAALALGAALYFAARRGVRDG